MAGGRAHRDGARPRRAASRASRARAVRAGGRPAHRARRRGRPAASPPARAEASRHRAATRDRCAAVPLRFPFGTPPGDPLWRSVAACVGPPGSAPRPAPRTADPGPGPAVHAEGIHRHRPLLPGVRPRPRLRRRRVPGRRVPAPGPRAPPGQPRRGRRDLHPGARRGRPGGVRHRHRHGRRRGLRGRRHADPVHDPVDGEAAHLRDDPRPARRGRGPAADRRRAHGRRVQRDLAVARDRHAAQPDGQRGRDRGGRHGAAGRGPGEPDRTDLLVERSGGSPAARSTWTRPSTAPSATPATATARSPTSCAAPAPSTTTPSAVARRLLPPVLRRGRRARPRADRRDAGRRRPPPAHRASVAAGEDTVRDVLSSWRPAACTTARASGCSRWACPAKSGVSGGILAVLPGQLGIGVWSPRLDARGNSVRGVAVCRDLAQELDLHLVAACARSAPCGPGRRSRGGRPSEPERAASASGSSPTRGARSCWSSRATIGFVAVETLAREAAADGDHPAAVVVDLRRATRVDPAVDRAARGPRRRPRGRAARPSPGAARRPTRPRSSAWTTLLADHAARRRRGGSRSWTSRSSGPRTSSWPRRRDRRPPRGAALRAARPTTRRWPGWTRRPSSGSRAALRAAAVPARRRDRPPGRAGRGAVPGHGRPAVVWVPRRRAATRGGWPRSRPGGMVGELAFLGREQRTADVYADTEVEAYVLRSDAFERSRRRTRRPRRAFLRRSCGSWPGSPAG